MNKLTPQGIAKVIKEIQYQILDGTTTTICQLTLQNGFTVIGTSACLNPADFVELTGRQIAYKRAEDQVWVLEGYLSKSRQSEKIRTSCDTHKDATYDRDEIACNPVWNLAFVISEVHNDYAPVGWGNYIELAECLMARFEFEEKI